LNDLQFDKKYHLNIMKTKNPLSPLEKRVRDLKGGEEASS